MEYDFSGWATRANVKCSDGRVIMKDAFKVNDGQTVPLVWNHSHNEPLNVLGHALLENRDEGVYAYCTFNETENGLAAKEAVKHGDITALSIYANKLKQKGANVIHGAIREVSLVLAGANPSAFIDTVVQHSDDIDEEAIIFTGEDITLFHSEDEELEADDISHADDGENKKKEKKKETLELSKETNPESKEDENMAEASNNSENEKTIKDVIDTMNEEQKTAMYYIIGTLVDDDDDDENDFEGGNDNMKHNVFDQDEMEQGLALSHSDQMDILNLAKNKSVGTWKNALEIYAEENSLQHGFESVETLFPDYEWVKPGAPEMVTRDQTWVDSVLSRVHKSPISRVRMRQADVRPDTIRAMGYQKSKEKQLIGSIKLINRSFDPQTIYVKDKIERDDMIDITDFDVVAYQQSVMRMALNEEIATAIMIGDGRDEGDEHKIYETHIKPIWHDDELYCIHTDVDIKAARAELQGTNTAANFGDNYVYAEAIIASALYAREKYKGSGSPEFYCTPHLLNVMLLARDLNGRRIYNSKADLAAALNVSDIHTVEQFENKTRTEGEGRAAKTKKLLGLFVNLDDYQVGSTKGGQITNFDDFDIDFNQYKYLMETRLSGALTRVFSAIALEEDVTATEVVDG